MILLQINSRISITPAFKMDLTEVHHLSHHPRTFTKLISECGSRFRAGMEALADKGKFGLRNIHRRNILYFANTLNCGFS